MTTSVRVTAALVVVTIVTFVLVPYDLLDFVPATIGPFGPIPRVDFSDIARFGAFVVVGLAICGCFPRRIRSALFIVVVACAGLEIVQSYVPGRHGRFSDFAVKAGGVYVGAALWVMIRAAYRKRSG